MGLLFGGDIRLWCGVVIGLWFGGDIRLCCGVDVGGMCFVFVFLQHAK